MSGPLAAVSGGHRLSCSPNSEPESTGPACVGASGVWAGGAGQARGQGGRWVVRGSVPWASTCLLPPCVASRETSSQRPGLEAQ